MPNYYGNSRYYKRRGAYTKPRYYKRGGYIADGLGNIGGHGGRALGKVLGGMLEKLTGAGAYRKRTTRRKTTGTRGAYYTRGSRGAYGRRMTGRGSYNEASNGMMAPIPPRFGHSNNKNWVEICHREYIGDLYSSSSANTLAISSFYINASDTQAFPWLSQIAAVAYQQYEMCGCVFEFQSFSADALNSTNTALGTVVAAINYDATDPIPTTRAQLENTDWSQAYKPSQSFDIPVECDRKETFANGLLYTRQSASIPTGQDRRLYDMARLDIATLGVQGTSVNLGSLYVKYKVRLYKAIQFPPLILAGCYHTWNKTSIAAATTPIGIAANDTIVRNNIGLVHTAPGNILTLPLAAAVPNAVYQLTLYWTGSSTAVSAPAITFGGCLAAVYGTGGGGSMDTTNYSNSGTTCTLLSVTYWFQVSATPVAAGTITVGLAGTLPAGTTSCDVQIQQLSGVFNQNI